MTIDPSAGRTHTLNLWQENAPEGELDLMVWFDAIEVRDADGNAIPIDAFIEAGIQWWDTFFAEGQAREASSSFFEPGEKQSRLRRSPLKWLSRIRVRSNVKPDDH